MGSLVKHKSYCAVSVVGGTREKYYLGHWFFEIPNGLQDIFKGLLESIVSINSFSKLKGYKMGWNFWETTCVDFTKMISFLLISIEYIKKNRFSLSNFSCPILTDTLDSKKS